MPHPRWSERWQEGRIGFHRSDVNPGLLRHYGTFLTPGSTVLVPLCGKTVDLTFLAEKGHRVIGVELIEKAAREYFSEHGLSPDESLRDGNLVLTGGGVEIWVADITALSDTAFVVDAVWDRAAMIALEAPERLGYCKKVMKWMRPGAKLLLDTMSYDQSRLDGPPFSVSDGKVREAYATYAKIQRLEHGPADFARGDPDLVFTTSLWLIVRR